MFPEIPDEIYYSVRVLWVGEVPNNPTKAVRDWLAKPTICRRMAENPSLFVAVVQAHGRKFFVMFSCRGRNLFSNGDLDVNDSWIYHEILSYNKTNATGATAPFNLHDAETCTKFQRLCAVFREAMLLGGFFDISEVEKLFPNNKINAWPRNVPSDESPEVSYYLPNEMFRDPYNPSPYALPGMLVRLTGLDATGKPATCARYIPKAMINTWLGSMREFAHFVRTKTLAEFFEKLKKNGIMLNGDPNYGAVDASANGRSMYGG
jgi:hypothetical protein